MSDLPPAASRMVRKSAYGRTQLFLPTAGTLLREVKCMGGVNKHDAAHVYHMLPSPPTDSCCWHCCEPLDDASARLPLPRLYDVAERVYYVYGAVCSPACAKAYVLEHTTFDRGQHLNTLVKMLRDVYGVTGPIVEAPPRAAMRRFGGPFDPSTLPRAVCKLVEPPFVSYCMIAEERAGDDGMQHQLPTEQKKEEEDLEEPDLQCMFDDFVRLRQNDDDDDDDTVATTKTTKATATSKPPTVPAKRKKNEVGPMTRFIKSRTASESQPSSSS